jgi:hypothetical protein
MQRTQNCRDGIDFPGIFLGLSGLLLSARRFRVAVIFNGLIVRDLRGALSASFSA